MKLLVDSGEFMDALRTDLAAATRSVLAQTMSFEGDRAGQRFANLLIGSRCADRRLIVDCFSRHIVSDRFVHAPGAQRDPELRRELYSTAATHEALRRAGVDIRFANPVGVLMHRFPARNHKKSVVIDDRIAYVGGLNLSDHNFAWHDLMLRIESPVVARFLAADLHATWRGRPRARWASFDRIAIGITNGRRNARIFAPVLDAIRDAREDVLIETPYLTFPFVDHLRAARRRGAHVRVIAPTPHPWPSFDRYLRWECERYGFELMRLRGPTHVKAMLIDGRRLVLGSSNFDFLSYRMLHEIIAIVDDPAIITDFTERVARADLARSTPQAPGPSPSGALHRWVMATAGEAAARLYGV